MGAEGEGGKDKGGGGADEGREVSVTSWIREEEGGCGRTEDGGSRDEDGATRILHRFEFISRSER